MVWRILERFDEITNQECLNAAINDASIKTQALALISPLKKYSFHVPLETQSNKVENFDGKSNLEIMPSKRQNLSSNATKPSSKEITL